MKYLISRPAFIFLFSFWSFFAHGQQTKEILIEIDDATPAFRTTLIKQSILESTKFFNLDTYQIQIKVNTHRPDLVIEIDNYLVDFIKADFYHNGKSTDRLVLPNYEDRHRNSVFYENLNRGDVLTAKIEVRNSATYSIPLNFFSKKNYSEVQNRKLVLIGVFSGVLLLFFVLMVIRGYSERRRLYWYYSCYIIFTALFFWLENAIVNMFSTNFESYNEPFVLSVVVCSSLFLVLFSVDLVPTKHKVLNLTGRLLVYGQIIILIVLWSPLMSYAMPYEVTYNMMLVLLITSYFYTFMRSFFYYGNLKYGRSLLVVGYSFLLVGVLLKPLSFLGLYDYGWQAKYGAMFGQFLEILFLTIFIVRNDIGSNRDKSRIEKDLFNFQKAALKAQMSPHFVFNALNSIQNFIMTNDKLNAMEYLSKFATLIRSNLHNIEEDFVSLGSEVDTLTNYLELEQLRFGKSFEFAINLPPKLSSMAIPPMLIQPIVENAVLHGVKDLEQAGFVSIDFIVVENQLQVTVADNGNGIKDKKASDNKKLQHKSMGLEVTRERLALLNGQKENNIVYRRSDDNRTLVQINIKIAEPVS